MSVYAFHLGFRNKKEHALLPIYHVNERIVLYNDKVLLALPIPHNLFKLCPKEFAKWPHSYFEMRYSQVCNCLQSTLNGIL